MILFTSYSVPGHTPSSRDIHGIVPPSWPSLPVCDWITSGTPVRAWSNHGLEVASLYAAPHNTVGPRAPITVCNGDPLLVDFEPAIPNRHKHAWRAIVHGMLGRHPGIEPVCYGLIPFSGARGLPSTASLRRAEEAIEADMDDVVSDIASAGGALSIDVYPWGGYTEAAYLHWFESRYEAAMAVAERHGMPLWLIGGVRRGDGDYYGTPALSDEQMGWQVRAMKSHSGPCAVWAPIVDERALTETPERLAAFAAKFNTEAKA